MNPGEDLDGQRRRADRTLRFCADQVAALRRELGLDAVAPPAALRPIAAQLDRVVAMIAAKRRALDAATTPDALARLNLDELVKAHKALLAIAQPYRRGSGALPPPPSPPSRATGPIRKPATGPIAPRASGPLPAPIRPPAKGPTLTDRLQDLFGPRLARPEAPPVAPAPDTAELKRRRHLETFVTFGRQVLAAAGPRLQAVESALDAAQRHAGVPVLQACELGSAAAKDAGVEPQLLVWIPRLVRLNLAHPTAPRIEKHALGQWGDARGQHAQAQDRLQALRAGDLAALAAYRPAAAGAALMPLTHLPTTFREVPVLNELFPALRAQPPEWQRWRRDLDAYAEPPAPPPAAPPAPTAASDEGDASRRRLSAIVAYLQNPTGDPAYADPTVMFKIVAEEHLYHSTRLATLPPDDPGRAGAATRQQQMAALLKQLAAKGRP